MARPSKSQPAEFAPGLPDPKRFGHPGKLPLNQLLSYVVQHHKAQRAGPHFDTRFGPDQGHKPTMMSWASRYLPTEPGKKTMAFQQPLHTGAYADFEGTIVSGYGAGTVRTHDKGSVIVTKAGPDKISFIVAHKKHPETFTMVRQSGPPDATTSRQRRTQGGSWLLINTTPTDVIKHKKVRYAKVPAEEVEKLFSPDYVHQAKLDGAAALYRLLADRIEVLSYRPSAEGRPIVHTYRVGGTTNVSIPKQLVGSVLRGELYGVRTSTGRAIPPQELGGILNSTTQQSIQKQRAQRVSLKNMVFDVLRHGKQDIPITTPFAERSEKLRDIIRHLPTEKFHLPESAGTPDEQRALWDKVTSGKHPLTHEGIVAWPKAGGRPTKVKLYDEHDVYVTDIFPGKKRLEGVGAGGFGYSLQPGGSRVGEVGTGLSEELRQSMLNVPDQYIGRVARVKAQEMFPSGALRAPSLIGMHEDYPAVKAAADDDYYGDPYEGMSESDIDKLKTQQQAESLAYTPTNLSEYGSTALGLAAVPAAVGTAWGGVRAGWRKLKSPNSPIKIGPGGKGIGAAIKSRWTPKALGKEFLLNAYHTGLLPTSAVINSLMLIPDALTDPDYQMGRKSFGSAAHGVLKSRAQALQLRTQKAFSNPVKGLIMSPLHAAMYPVAALYGLGQSVARPLTKGSADAILGPAIEKVGQQLGVHVNTLGDLVKAAADIKAVPAAEAPMDVNWSDRMRAWMIGMKPEQLVRLRRGLATMSDVFQIMQQQKAAS